MSIISNKILWFILICNNICIVTRATPSSISVNNVVDIIKFYTLQSDAELSDACRKQSDIYYQSLITAGASAKEKWAKEMIDASSKIQAGILFGSFADLGAFDECLQIYNEKDDIKGKYCLTSVNIPFLENKSASRLHSVQKLFLDGEESDNTPGLAPQVLWSICVPNACTAKDVEAHLNSSIKIPLLAVKEDQCQTMESQPKLNTGDWITIGILLFLACIILFSTSYDVFLQYNEKDPPSALLIAFSWFSGFQKLIKINKNPDLLPCLNGIRVLSMFWIIHGHEILYMAIRPMINMKEGLDWLTHVWSLFTLSSTVSVDTFFFLSGLLLMNGFLKSQAKKIRFNIPMFYIHRYIRITPPYAALIVLYITFFMKLGSGPMWELNNQRFQDNCKEYWWSSLLYIQNFVDANRFCPGQSWYLFVDMQLFILSPLILIPISKWPKIIPYLFGILIIIFSIIPTIVAWHYELTVVLTNGDSIPNWNQVYYAQVHTRAGPWIIGLGLGYILYQTKHKKIRINKLIAAVLWLLTAIVMLYIIFGNYPELTDDFHYSRLYSSVFIGFHRNVWTFGLSWIVFACIHGYGGPVNWFLSLPVFQFFAKITYALYLLSETFQIYDRGILRVPIIFQDFIILQSFFSTTCFCSFLSIIWVLCFEFPFGVIDGVFIKSVSKLLK